LLYLNFVQNVHILFNHFMEICVIICKYNTDRLRSSYLFMLQNLAKENKKNLKLAILFATELFYGLLYIILDSDESSKCSLSSPNDNFH
jgi:hypothetical protein